ncbi:glycosyltransferase [Neogemmobacter tilapiae]|uniref:Glycosyl transferase n=1 Tax=Neogemmobacter tilapiae TaxID=875041 RepID=A0A918TZB2_9RHOB|nr:glycosyltransferase [Gemmobacter tilapiae]GHC66660.1 glycosyl transferase [Gemmobacter tilapiae]
MSVEGLKILPAAWSNDAPVLPRPIVPPSKPSLPALMLGRRLLANGMVGSDDLVAALARHHHGQERLEDLLVAHKVLSRAEMTLLKAHIWGLPVIDPISQPPDCRLLDRWGPSLALREMILPWRETGGGTVVIVAEAEVFLRHKSHLEALFGQVMPALASAETIAESVLSLRGAALDRAAQERVDESESCRSLARGALPIWLCLGLLMLMAGLVILPQITLVALTLWAVLTLVLATLLKSAAMLAALFPARREGPRPIIARLPVVSVMVPLYREESIAARLVSRLERLDYPRDLLDILLVVEEDDQITRRALKAAALPRWMRVVVVPQGGLKTKPRALNHALDRCRGSIVGIYDAEDAPDPDQIRKVVARFHARGAEVACLQGILDFYNPTTNWLSRCFTVEYAAWFRLMLPGLARLGLAVPLGGTTLFFRRAALEKLGGWDAHNVTEDADLGMRLARHGYRTELIGTVTGEEANCRVIPWIKQRSRWLKGYMMTYAVHMRSPGLLLRQLGWWKFLGFQVFFLTTLSQFLLAPLLLSFWALPLGFGHPVLAMLPTNAGQWIGWAFLWSEAALLVGGWIGLKLSGQKMSAAWVLMQHLYFPLATLAAYKAFWEMLVKPFYWDKTQHGLFDH